LLSERAARGSEETSFVHNKKDSQHLHQWRVQKNSPLFTALLLCALFAATASITPAQDAPAPPTPKASLAEADARLKLGKPDEALTILNAFSATDPAAPGLDAMLGKAYFQSKKFPHAIVHLKAALKQNSEDWASTQLLALTYYASGDYQDALPLLEKLGPRLPAGNADGPYLLGTCYIMTQRYDDARKKFAQMFSVSPDSAMAYLMFGKILIRQRLEDRAVPQIEQALQLDPRLPMAHFLLGEIDLFKKNATAAVGEFQQELAINPTVWLVYWRLGDAYVQLEKYDEAEKVLKEAIWLNEWSSGAYILLGQIALKKGDSDIAAGFLERALRLDPQNFWVHYFLAKAYHNLGRTAEANQQFEISKSMRDDQINDDRKMLQAAP
jgi:tetratricopeptide (TPR) repeat protein